MFKILDRYIIGKFLGTFFFTLGIFILIAVVFNISEYIDDFLEKEAPIKAIIFDYYLNYIPFLAGLLSPLLIFIAVILFTSKMANNTEIVAILSSGVSFKRLLLPYFLVATLLSVLAFVFNAYITPKANKGRIEFEEMYVKKSFEPGNRNIHMQLDKNTYIYLESYNTRQNLGQKFSIENFSGDTLNFKLLGERFRWIEENQAWRIENYSIRRINGMKESLEYGRFMDTTLSLVPEDFIPKDLTIEKMTLGELDQFIETEKMRSSASIQPFLIEKYRRYAYPFIIYILVLIGVAVSSRKIRGGVGLHLGIGITFCAVFIVMFYFSTIFATKGGLHPLVAVWIPNVTFAIVGIYLLNRAPK